MMPASKLSYFQQLPSIKLCKRLGALNVEGSNFFGNHSRKRCAAGVRTCYLA
jgi:hypothetical protein